MLALLLLGVIRKRTVVQIPRANAVIVGQLLPEKKTEHPPGFDLLSRWNFQFLKIEFREAGKDGKKKDQVIGQNTSFLGEKKGPGVSYVS